METEIIKTEDLDATKIIVPEGYAVIIDPELEVKEKKEVERLALQEQLSQMQEPTDDELIAYAKVFHPYYEILNKLN